MVREKMCVRWTREEALTFASALPRQPCHSFAQHYWQKKTFTHGAKRQGLCEEQTHHNHTTPSPLKLSHRGGSPLPSRFRCTLPPPPRLRILRNYFRFRCSARLSGSPAHGSRKMATFGANCCARLARSLL